LKRVLIISYLFPPDGGAGTQRATKFCKYLPDRGWNCTVVTREPPKSRGKWEPQDQTLLNEIGAATEVIRVAPGNPGNPASSDANAPANWASDLPLVDLPANWLAPAFEAIKQRLSKGDIDAVLITMSPFDLSYLALKLKEHGVKQPVIVDLRDPWMLDGWRLVGHYFKWRVHMNQMSRTFRVADGIIANTPESRTAFLNAVPGLDPTRIAVIPNGYDTEDFHTTAPLPEAPPADRFLLVHTGSFHSSYIYQKTTGIVGLLRSIKNYRPEPIVCDARTPLYLLRAVAKLRQENHPAAAALRIVFVGSADDATQRCVRESGVADQVTQTGYVSHPISVAWLNRADALFLPLHGLPPGHRSLIVPGKTYEYLASGKPILACLPEGDARDLVKAAGAGPAADPTSVEQISAGLVSLFDAWRAGKLKGGSPSDPVVARYDRRALTGDLATFMAGLTAR
jgi:glycosyltransferase involved in cell wall biosynthesis